MLILHVEDDADTRGLVSYVLKAHGWDEMSVSHPTEALFEAATRKSRTFDVFLLDKWIQGHSGNALWVGLKVKRPKPIVFYSAARVSHGH